MMRKMSAEDISQVQRGIAERPDSVADLKSINVPTLIVPTPKQATYAAFKMGFDPGIFTFGGNGQGQAAVLNVDPTSGVVTVNGTGAASAPKGSAIEIFMTGLGDLAGGVGALIDGQVASGAVALVEDSYRVLIGGQSAPIFYAGMAGTGVAGLVQINAIVPPGTGSGAQTLTVEIGPLKPAGAPPVPTVAARRSQTGVIINVK